MPAFKFVTISLLAYLCTSCATFAERAARIDASLDRIIAQEVADTTSVEPEQNSKAYCQNNFGIKSDGYLLKKFWFYVDNGNIDCVELQLQEAERQNIPLTLVVDEDGKTVFMRAAEQANFELLCTVLNYLPKNSQGEKESLGVNRVDGNGKSALHYAIQGRPTDDQLIAQILLIDAGIDHTISDLEERTALMKARYELRHALEQQDTAVANKDKNWFNKLKHKISNPLENLQPKIYAYNQLVYTLLNFEQGCYYKDGSDCVRNLDEVRPICNRLFLDKRRQYK